MTEDESGVAMVRQGYNEETRNLNFRVGIRDIDRACEALEAIGDYNDFNGARVGRALREAVGGGGRFLTFYVGREGSPVLYVGPIYANSDKEEGAIIAAMREARADEVSREGRLIRAWWD